MNENVNSLLGIEKSSSDSFFRENLPKLPAWFSLVFWADMVTSILYYAPFCFKALSVLGPEFKQLVFRCIRPTAVPDLEYAHIHIWHMIETTQVTALFRTLALGHVLLFVCVIIANVGMLTRKRSGITAGWIAVAIAFVLFAIKLLSPFYFDGLSLFIGIPFNTLYIGILLRTSRLAREVDEDIPFANKA